VLVCTILAICGRSRAQFVGFFDHARGPGTHRFTLSFYATTNGASGLFTNITDGVTTAVSLITTTNGTGTPITLGTLANVPAPGTPAYQTFNGFVDFNTNSGSAIQIPANSTLVYTFSNLNPNARYSFKGTAIRGNPAYTNRWGKVSILGVDAATPNHTSNALTSADAPADLAPNEVAINFGVNHLANQGDMAVWDDIVPGADGIFQVVCTRYTGFVPKGSSTAGNPPYGYAISGIRLEETVSPPDPITITSGPDPATLTIDQGQTATFRVQVTGSAPRFEWFREDGGPIRHAVATNGASLTLTNLDPGDSGNYRLRITNSASSVVSGPASLTVIPDTTPPQVSSATGLLSGDRFIMQLSEPVDGSKPLSAAKFTIRQSAGGGNLNVTSIALTNGSNILITTSSARVPGLNYTIDIAPNAVFDPAGNGNLAQTIAPNLEVLLIGFTNFPWRYSTEGIDLGIDFSDPAFDDTTWAEGTSVFDGKMPQARNTVAGFPVATQLPLTNSLYPSSSAVIPSYYFRTHFNLQARAEDVLALRLRTVVDDFDNFYINGSEVYRNAGYPSGWMPPSFGYSGGTAVGTAGLLGPFDLNHSTLVGGDNVCAVILNQVNGTSSDATFAYELVATITQFSATGAALSMARNANSGAITLTWPPATGAQLYESDTTDPLNSAWTLVSGASDGFYTVDAPAGQKFYTLRR